jgi:hypothetical protein
MQVAFPGNLAALFHQLLDMSKNGMSLGACDYCGGGGGL